MGSAIFVVPNQYVISPVYQLIGRIKTILVLTDLSDQANMALPVAMSLAIQHGADVRVLHYLPTAIIDPVLSAATITVGRYLKEQEADAQTTLTALCERYQTDAVLVTPILSRHEKGLFGAVAEEDVDLVVPIYGNAGRKGKSTLTPYMPRYVGRGSRVSVVRSTDSSASGLAMKRPFL